MRILLVSQYFWPEVFRVNDLVEGWHERGHEVTVLTGIPNYPAGKPFVGYSPWGPTNERYGPTPVVRVPLVPRGRGQQWRMVANYLSFALSASTLGALRCRGPYDCIFVYQLSPVTVGIPAAFLKRLLGVPIAFWIQDLWPESLSAVGRVRSRFLMRQVGRLVEWIYRRCDLILGQSPSFLEAVEARGVATERLRYLPNWCENFYEPVDEASTTEQRAALPNGFVILFAGNLGHAQGLETILNAAQQLRHRPDIHWVFLGEGARRSWLQTEIAERELATNVHWLGAHPAKEMPKWFAAADALLLTLGRDPVMALTVPTKLQSYLACARPVLAALDGEGAAAVEAAEAGLVGPAEDSARLAQNATALADQSLPELTAMGRRGRDFYLRNFGRERLLDQLDDWLASLLRADI